MIRWLFLWFSVCLLSGSSISLAAADDWGELADDEELEERKQEIEDNRVVPENFDCGLGNSDGQKFNNTSGVSLKFGPPGAQNGHSNPLGIPPGAQDIEFTYLNKCGFEGSISIVPGPTFGVRYRGGDFFYGSVGGGLLITANAAGPGLYSAVGVNFVRPTSFNFEFEFKQGLGIGQRYKNSKVQVISPYAFRFGLGYYW